MYRDGLLAGTVSSSTPVTTNGFPLMFGVYNDGNDNPLYGFLDGNIDEVRIWNAARSQAQIQAGKDYALNVPQLALVGYWRLDDGGTSSAIQTVADLSPTGANGTRGATTGAASDDPTWSTIDFAPLIYPSSGVAGQTNGADARLEINGVGTGTSPGPFVVTAVQGGSLSFAWTGAPGMPCILLMGPLNVGNTVNVFLGTVDIGSPCLSPPWSDVIVLFDGTSPAYLNLFQTNGAGTATQTFSLPIGLPPGPMMTVQGLMGTTSGVLFRLTATFQIVL